MDELNAAPSSTDPGDNPHWTPDQLAAIQAGGVAPMQVNQIAEAGNAGVGESSVQSSSTTTQSQSGSSFEESGSVPSASDSAESDTTAAIAPEYGPTTDAPAVGGGIDAPSHLMLLDVMLAEIERKIAAGIHLFAHEVTAARDHLAKLL